MERGTKADEEAPLRQHIIGRRPITTAMQSSGAILMARKSLCLRRADAGVIVVRRPPPPCVVVERLKFSSSTPARLGGKRRYGKVR